MANNKIVVSYSELDTFRQCPMKHALAYKQRWTRPVEEGSPLNKDRSGEVFSSPNPSPMGCKWRCDFMEAHLMMRKGTPIRVALTDQRFVVNKERH